MASDLLATIRSEIETRLVELRPLLAEYERLLDAADVLGSTDGDAPADAPPGDGFPTGEPSADEPPVGGPATNGPSATAGGESAVDTVADASPTRERRRGRRGSAAGVIARVAAGPVSPGDARERKRALRASAQEAILAALGHGSHTQGELVTVTALPGSNIRGGISRLLALGAVTKTKRDGKTAYALSSAPAEEPAEH